MRSRHARPDPITGKNLAGAVAGVTGGYALGAVADALAGPPEGGAWVDWAHWGLTLAAAMLAVYVQSQRAKRDTTPLESPRDEYGRKLEPVGTQPGAAQPGVQNAPPLDQPPGGPSSGGYPPG